MAWFMTRTKVNGFWMLFMSMHY